MSSSPSARSLGEVGKPRPLDTTLRPSPLAPRPGPGNARWRWGEECSPRQRPPPYDLPVAEVPRAWDADQDEKVLNVFNLLNVWGRGGVSIFAARNDLGRRPPRPPTSPAPLPTHTLTGGDIHENAFKHAQMEFSGPEKPPLPAHSDSGRYRDARRWPSPPPPPARGRPVSRAAKMHPVPVSRRLRPLRRRPDGRGLGVRASATPRGLPSSALPSILRD